jgi:hypothetical protein
MGQKWLLKPIILATWEEKSQKVTVQGQPGQNLVRTRLNQLKLDMVVHAYDPAM